MDFVKFNSLDGLKVIAIFGVVLMHIYTNFPYTFNNMYVDIILSSFTNFVFLFMVLSSFGMCCGYYDKIKKSSISLEEFYKRRFLKVIPFFFFLLVIAVIYEHSLSALIEAFTNATLFFNFLQKDISVLGVAWFLGLIFVFYMIFPFFVFLFSNRKRAWLMTIVALGMNYVGDLYFHVGRVSFFYSFIYFCIGGLLYLYRKEIVSFFQKWHLLSIFFVVISVFLYYCLEKNRYFYSLSLVLLCISLIVNAISSEGVFLNNKFMHFVGNVSMEIYLSHMLFFRIAEKFFLVQLFSNGYLSYFFVFIFVILCSLIFSLLFRLLWRKVERKMFHCENIVS